MYPGYFPIIPSKSIHPLVARRSLGFNCFQVTTPTSQFAIIACCDEGVLSRNSYLLFVTHTNIPSIIPTRRISQYASFTKTNGMDIWTLG
jgi:hypothetical protein